jgi:hypothetical protein
MTETSSLGSGSSPPRAIRFAAVLTRSDGRWLFRHIQFHWDDSPETLERTAPPIDSRRRRGAVRFKPNQRRS